MADIVIPYEPRPLQRAIHDGMDRSRFGAAVCHRRFGKTVCAVNHLQKGAVQCRRPRPRFGYIAPTYTQGKAIAWDYMRYYARPIPGMGINISELRVDYPHGGQVRIFGADNPDSLRGLYFDGVVLDEYGLMPPRIFTEVIRPTLSDREGWALFLGTPNGKNQFYDVVQTARNHDDWFFAEYKASETGIIPQEELDDIAKKAQIYDFIITLPDGYETYIGDRGVKLSGGERQRLSIARAILKKSDILIVGYGQTIGRPMHNYLIKKGFVHIKIANGIIHEINLARRLFPFFRRKINLGCFRRMPNIDNIFILECSEKHSVTIHKNTICPVSKI